MSHCIRVYSSSCRRHEATEQIKVSVTNYYHLRRCLQSVRQEVNRLHGICKTEASALSPLGNFLTEPLQRCTLLVIGPTSSGKSSFINILLRSGLDPLPPAPEYYSVCTMKFVRYFYSERPKITVVNDQLYEVLSEEFDDVGSGGVEKCLRALHQMIVSPDVLENIKDTTDTEDNFRRLFKASVGLPIDTLKTGLNIIDAPAFDVRIPCDCGSDDYYYRHFLPSCRPIVCLYLFGAAGPLRADIDHFKMLKQLSNDGCRFICAMNLESAEGIESDTKATDAQRLGRANDFLKEHNKIKFDNAIVPQPRNVPAADRINVPGIALMTVQQHQIDKEATMTDDVGRLQEWFQLEIDVAKAIDRSTREYVSNVSQTLLDHLSELRQKLQRQIDEHERYIRNKGQVLELLARIHLLLSKQIKSTVDSVSLKPDYILSTVDDVLANLAINEMHAQDDADMNSIPFLRRDLLKLGNFHLPPKLYRAVLFLTNHFCDSVTDLFCKGLLKTDDLSSLVNYNKQAIQLIKLLGGGPRENVALPVDRQVLFMNLALHPTVYAIVLSEVVDSVCRFFNGQRENLRRDMSEVETILALGSCSGAGSDPETPSDNIPRLAEKNPEMRCRLYKAFGKHFLESVIDTRLMESLVKKIQRHFDDNLETKIEKIRQQYLEWVTRCERDDERQRIVRLQTRLLPFISLLSIRLRSIGCFGNSVSHNTQRIRKLRTERKPLCMANYAHRMTEVFDLFKILADEDTANWRNLVPIYQWSVVLQEQKFYLIKPVVGRPFVDELTAEKYSLTRRLQYSIHLLQATIFVHKHQVLLNGARPEILFFSVKGDQLQIDLETHITHQTFSKLKLRNGKCLPPIHLHPEVFLTNRHSYASDLYSCTTMIWFILSGGFCLDLVPDRLREFENPDELRITLVNDQLPIPFPEPVDGKLQEVYEKMCACWDLAFDDDKKGLLYAKIFVEALENAMELPEG